MGSSYADIISISVENMTRVSLDDVIYLITSQQFIVAAVLVLHLEYS